jgi:hypothetical protein
MCAYEQFKDLPNFLDIKNIDTSHNRLSVNIDTGDFISGEFDKHLENDLENLCIYDNLIRLDIKQYYEMIYTHKINFIGTRERYLTNLNLGATNGLILGNYLSLYIAQAYLENIGEDIEKLLVDQNVDCVFSYFSDDFYFICNSENNQKVIEIFDKVLEKYELERNDKKVEVWNYKSYTDYYLAEKYWKKIISDCTIRFQPNKNDNIIYFLNQIIYRMSNLIDDKQRRVFINNFFKTKYFKELNLNKYKFREYSYHQLCFI